MHSSEVAVVGVAFDGRQDVLADLYHGLKTREHVPTAELRREPDNSYDPSAVAVIVDNTWHIGYIPKALAARWAARMDDGEDVHVTGFRVVKSMKRDGESYGARIDVTLEDRKEEAAH